jgi:catechol 2,3-dioxygenase
MSSDEQASPAVPAEGPIHPQTTMGAVSLTVADLETADAFYQRALGLHALERSGGRVVLGTTPGAPLVELVGERDAPARPRRSTGLFHLAILVPDRAELARSLRRVLAAGAGFTGASDHLVSEALYLNDPEGNGIEIYRDRPREEWRREDGQIAMDTLPLDVEGVLSALPEGGADEGVPSGTRMGHVHLQVRDLAEAEDFYGAALGFEPTVRGYPGALFVSAGGYHHHLGLNTWGTAGAPPPPAGARGLRAFRVVVPTVAEVSRVAGRLEARGIEATRSDDGLRVTDPTGNRVIVQAREDAAA